MENIILMTITHILPFIKNIHQSYHTPKLDNLPSFTGGLVGYLGYDPLNHKIADDAPSQVYNSEASLVA